MASGGSDAAAAAFFEARPDAAPDWVELLFPSATNRLEHSTQDSSARGPLDFKFSSFPPYPLRDPIEWDADPYENGSWQFRLQRLVWLRDLPTTGEAFEFDTSPFVIRDWVENVLFESPNLRWTWSDHGLPARLDFARQYAAALLARPGKLDASLLRALGLIILSHTVALGFEQLYAPRHNHGFMMDLALLRSARAFHQVEGFDSLEEVAVERLLDQVRAASVGDGSHSENSPGYHLTFIKLMLSAMSAFEESGRAVPEQLLGEFELLSGGLAHFLRADRSLPQFGDTESGPQWKKIKHCVRRARELGLDSSGLRQVEFVWTGGKRGVAPTEETRIFERGGYAAFRSSWRDDATCVHFKCRRPTKVHAHDDETSFTLWSRGYDIVVDPGYFNYERSDPRTAYAMGARGHNALCVDGAEFDARASGRITNFGASESIAFVTGVHERLSGAGVPSVARTLVFDRRDSIVLLDEARLLEARVLVG